jgi:hypothetical protein
MRWIVAEFVSHVSADDQKQQQQQQLSVHRDLQEQVQNDLSL